MTEIPEPSSPLPWVICADLPGYSNESHILRDKYHYRVLAHLRLTATWPSDVAYIVWAANNAPKLAAEVARLRLALESIDKHFEISAPNMPSVARAIAQKALKEQP